MPGIVAYFHRADGTYFVDGWARIGDEVAINEYMEIFIDRLKETLKFRAFQVAPAKMEAH